MKKYLFSLLLGLPVMLVQAQSEIVIKGSKQISEKQTPKQVLDSLHARFPNAEAAKVYQANGADAARGWDISKTDNLGINDELDYYTISFNRDGMKYYGLYDKHGKLLESKGQANVDELPKPVQDAINSLSKTKPGWKVVSKTGFREINYDKKKEYYEVVAEKGDAWKVLTYSPDGKLIKVKDKKAKK